MIHCRGLCKAFGEVPAVHDLCLDVASGEIVSLMGANGAGKSTTIQMLLGFLRPDRGTAFIAGIDVNSMPSQLSRVIGYVPENVSLYPRFSAIENVMYFSRLAGIATNASRARDYLTEVGLEQGTHHRDVSRFSKGMRQKVALAIAFAKQARVLLLDEPLSGLDPASAESISNSLRSAAARGTAILMATHDHYYAHQISTWIAIMTEGEISETIECSTVDPPQLHRKLHAAILKRSSHGSPTSLH